MYEGREATSFWGSYGNPVAAILGCDISPSSHFKLYVGINLIKSISLLVIIYRTSFSVFIQCKSAKVTVINVLSLSLYCN